jgi:protease-4
MRDMGTSGGYYIACGADRIFAEPTTWTANIGVLLPRISLAKLGEKYGIEDQTVVATGATFKNAGSLFKDDSPEQVAYWQGLADQAFDVFKNVVMQGRKLDAATVNKLADGQVRTGIDALKLKWIDDDGYLDDAIGAAEKQAGLTKARVLRYERHPSFFEALAGGSSSSKSQMVQAKVGGIDLGVDQNVLQHLMSSRPMYLWRGQ